jgi:hypothetical protein
MARIHSSKLNSWPSLKCFRELILNSQLLWLWLGPILWLGLLTQIRATGSHSLIDSEVCPGQCLSSGSSKVLHTTHADIQRPSLASWTERPVTSFKFPNHQLEVITWRLQLQCSMPPCNCNQSGHRPTATRWYSSRPDQVTGMQEAPVQ